MSDEQLRALERYLQSAPEDFLAWAQYLQTGARVGAYDPDNWAQAVSWLTKVPPRSPRPPGQPYDTTEALAADDARWAEAADTAEKILHGIRNTLGQLSAHDIQRRLEPIVTSFYSKPRPVVVIVSDDYGLLPIVEVDKTYRVMYDERHFQRRTEDIRQSRWKSVARSVLDTTPQYILETDVYFPGSYHEPPDSDQVTLVVVNNIRDLTRELIYAVEISENQEVYHDPREEQYDELIDQMSLAYRTETMQLIKETLDSLFSRYRMDTYLSTLFDEHNRFGIRIQADDLNFTVYDTKEFVWPYVTNQGMPVLPGSFIIESYLAGHTQRYFQQAAGGAVELLWQLWMKVYLDRHLTK